MAIDYTNLVNKGYQDTLGRAGDQAGIDYWKGQLSSGAVTPEAFNKSLLSGAKPGEFKSTIDKGYQEKFGRAADIPGQEYWSGQLKSGAVKPVDFGRSLVGGAKGDDLTDLIKKSYVDTLGRDADIPGLQYWQKEVAEGRVDPNRMNEALISGFKPNVTMPDFPGNQSRMNQGIPGYFEDLMGGIENYNKAYERLEGLPEEIDKWTGESLKRQRMTGDMSQGIMNRVAGQRAGGGIMGGTEAQNLEANEAARLNQIILENQNKIRQTGNQLKAGTIQGLPGQALQPVALGASLYGTTANEAANWGNIAMQTLLKGY